MFCQSLRHIVDFFFSTVVLAVRSGVIVKRSSRPPGRNIIWPKMGTS